MRRSCVREKTMSTRRSVHRGRRYRRHPRTGLHRRRCSPFGLPPDLVFVITSPGYPVPPFDMKPTSPSRARPESDLVLGACGRGLRADAARWFTAGDWIAASLPARRADASLHFVVPLKSGHLPDAMAGFRHRLPVERRMGHRWALILALFERLRGKPLSSVGAPARSTPRMGPHPAMVPG